MISSELRDLGDVISAIRSIPGERFASQRWFGDKDAQIVECEPHDLALVYEEPGAALVFCILDFRLRDSGGLERLSRYFVPLVLDMCTGQPEGEGWLARIGDEACLIDGARSTVYARGLIALIGSRSEFRAKRGVFEFCQTGIGPNWSVSEFRATSNTVVKATMDMVVKTFRLMHEGIHAELEVGTTYARLVPGISVPQVFGYALYRGSGGEIFSLCIVEEYMANAGTAWDAVVARLRRYGEACLLAKEIGESIGNLHELLCSAFESSLTLSAKDYLSQLGGSIIQALSELVDELEKLDARGETASAAGWIIRSHKAIEEAIVCQAQAVRGPIPLIRVHGDLHLEQLLVVPNGYAVIDFEGEPLASMEERRRPKSPLKDIAGMTRSFAYASHAASEGHLSLCGQAHMLRHAFLEGYRTSAPQNLIPGPSERFGPALALHEMEKAVYEAKYELRNRPDWVGIPLRGIRECYDRLCSVGWKGVVDPEE